MRTQPILALALAAALSGVAQAQATSPEPKPVLQPPAAPAPPAPSLWPAYILWTSGGVSLIAGTIFGVGALTAQSDYDAAPSYAGADKVHDRAIAADVFLGLGAILAVTGTIFFFVGDSEAGPSARAKPGAWTVRF